jgi:DNA-directed RNA polymerase specialized sigma24 family protein
VAKHGPETIARVCELYQSGLKLKDVADTVGVPLPSVWCLLQQAGVQCRPSPRKLTPEQVSEVVRRYEGGEPSTTIAESFRVDPSTVQRLLRRRSIELRPSPRALTSDQVGEAVTRYRAGENLKELGDSFGVSSAAVHGLLRRRAVAMRPAAPASRVTRPEAFSDPECDEVAAYMIGFLMADGCISDPPNRSRQVSIAIQEGDRCVLDRLNDLVGGGCTIGLRPQKKPNHQNQVALSFAHPRILSDLERHGLTPRKSFTAQLPPHLALNRHVWRGLIDGDGCLRWAAITGRKYPSVGFIGSRACVEQFAAFVRDLCPEYHGTARPARSVYECRLVGRYAAEVARVLYSDCAFALPRKLSLAREFAAWKPSRQRRRSKRLEPQ